MTAQSGNSISEGKLPEHRFCTVVMATFICVAGTLRHVVHLISSHTALTGISVTTVHRRDQGN